MAVELKSTFAPGGNLVTELPGGQSPAPYPNLSPAILQLLMARQRPQAPAEMPRAAYREAAPQRAPAMGTSQSAQSSQPQVVTRMRTIPKNPYDAMSRIPGGLGGTGDTNNVRPEKGYVQKDGSIQWEFDGAGSAFEDPHGGSGGIQGGGAASMLHASANLGGDGPENPIKANRDDYDPKTNLPRMAPIIAANQYNRNNDARGEGYGVDYNNRRPQMPRRQA